MPEKFTEEQYNLMIERLFLRFPSFQKDGVSAYKPGIANMESVDQLMGHPHRNYRIVHVAGTNGKGSVSNMLASVLAACGFKVGLYTSPHILDFRERMKVVADGIVPSEPERRGEKSVTRCVPKEYVYDFVCRWQDDFDRLDLSFFEITTIMALQWFADEKVDYVVLETGLGGRLDSTNIVTPVLSVITNIGLDHCDMLGNTLEQIAFEKAGIIKPNVPVVVGESHPETAPVFERKVSQTNLLIFADRTEPFMWTEHEALLAQMDLQGAYQKKNLRTVLAALDVLSGICSIFDGEESQVPSNSEVSGTFSEENRARCIHDAIANTACRTDFHGRWEKLSDNPLIICDIGHNEHGLRHNFAQLVRMKESGECSDLIIVYGSVADKDVDSVVHLMPEEAEYIFTQAHSKRALAAQQICEKYRKFCSENGRDAGRIHVVDNVALAVGLARDIAAGILAENSTSRPLIYIGGSTYVVSEAVSTL